VERKNQTGVVAMSDRCQ